MNMQMLSDMQQHAFRSFRWKALIMDMGERPRGVRAWAGWAWGQDLWLHGVPLIKVMVLANVLMWILLWATR